MALPVVASIAGLWLWDRLSDSGVDPTVPPDITLEVVATPPAFEFKEKCHAADGSLMWHKSDDVDDPEAGRMLACRRNVDFEDEEPLTLFSEYEDIKAKVELGEYAPATEEDRLRLYFQLVYPEADWSGVSEQQLVERYQDLELYYRLPRAIEPRTPRRIVRTNEPRFYRFPRGVVLDQAPNRKSPPGPYIEVTRSGAANRPYRDPADFIGTYYYPVRGSGVYLPLGNTLVAYNKVSALAQLGVTPEEMLKHAGKTFNEFLQADSEEEWKRILRKSPSAKRSKYWVKQNGVSYIPSALTRIVNEMTRGKCLRKACIKMEGGDKEVLVYYGLGASGDAFLAQLANDRGYDTVQLLREAQAGFTRDAVVGMELIHLMEPLASQAELVRLDPMRRPYAPTRKDAPPFNYLLKKKGRVRMDAIATAPEFDPKDDPYIVRTIAKRKTAPCIVTLTPEERGAGRDVPRD